MDKYLLYDPENGYSTFSSVEEIKKHVANQDYSEGYPDEQFLIYKLKERSVFKETDNINNYKCLKDISKNCISKDICKLEDDECEDAEQWPYNSYFGRVCELEWIKLEIIENELKEFNEENEKMREKYKLNHD
jgi:hypothetical protein